MKIELTKEILDFLFTNGHVIVTGEGTQYVYLPHWFKVENNNTVEILRYDNLPEELITVLEWSREKNNEYES